APLRELRLIGGEVQIHQLRFAPSARVAPLVQAVVRGDAVDERQRGVRVGELPGRSKRLAEHLLRRIACRFLIAQQPEAPAIDGRPPGLVQPGDVVAAHAPSTKTRHPGRPSRDTNRAWTSTDPSPQALLPAGMDTTGLPPGTEKSQAVSSGGAGRSHDTTSATPRIAAMISSEVPVGRSIHLKSSIFRPTKMRIPARPGFR